MNPIDILEIYLYAKKSTLNNRTHTQTRTANRKIGVEESNSR